MGKKIESAKSVFVGQLREFAEMETYMRFNADNENCLRGEGIAMSDTLESVERYMTKVHTMWDVLVVLGMTEVEVTDIIHSARNQEWERCRAVVRERKRDNV